MRARCALAALMFAGSAAQHVALDDDISELLQDHGLAHLEPRLRAEGLAELCDLNLLTDADLQVLGVDQLLQRRRLQRTVT